MDAKRRLIVQGFLFGAVVLTGMVFAAASLKNGKVLEAGMGILIAVLLGAFAVRYLKTNYEDASKGIPREDERSERIKQKAGYYSFMITLYVLLAIGYFSEMGVENPGLPAFRDISQATSVAVGLMALTFGISWWYFNSKGDA
ncbi:MAG: hypothetical protein V1835_03865 [Candidatus Micrarchaeota archaeon]